MTRSLPLLVLTLLMLPACASSADTARDDDRVAQTLASMDAALDLTDAQSDRIRDILVAQEASRPSGPPSRGGQRGQGGPPRGGDRDAQRGETDRQIEAVLTETQVVAYREWRAAQPRPQGPPPRTP
ncbi:MAG: hypothetical protein CMM84_20855 [Rhodothermaceae bacterium]|nr:hypothetical protein [Rhodothermaceae bacterium]